MEKGNCSVPGAPSVEEQARIASCELVEMAGEEVENLRQAILEDQVSGESSRSLRSEAPRISLAVIGSYPSI